MHKSSENTYRLSICFCPSNSPFVNISEFHIHILCTLFHLCCVSKVFIMSIQYSFVNKNRQVIQKGTFGLWLQVTDNIHTMCKNIHIEQSYCENTQIFKLLLLLLKHSTINSCKIPLFLCAQVTDSGSYFIECLLSGCMATVAL